jgi:hypothetical protein
MLPVRASLQVVVIGQSLARRFFMRDDVSQLTGEIQKRD